MKSLNIRIMILMDPLVRYFVRKGFIRAKNSSNFKITLGKYPGYPTAAPLASFFMKYINNRI